MFIMTMTHLTSVLLITLVLSMSTGGGGCTFLPPPPIGGILRPQSTDSASPSPSSSIGPFSLADLVARHREVVRQGHEIVSPYARAVLPQLITANSHMSTAAAVLPGLLAAKGTSKFFYFLDDFKVKNL